MHDNYDRCTIGFGDGIGRQTAQMVGGDRETGTERQELEESEPARQGPCGSGPPRAGLWREPTGQWGRKRNTKHGGKYDSIAAKPTNHRSYTSNHKQPRIKQLTSNPKSKQSKNHQARSNKLSPTTSRTTGKPIGRLQANTNQSK